MSSVLHSNVRRFTWFHDPVRWRRLLKILLWVVGIAVLLLICHVAGFDVRDWFSRLWDTMTDISIGYIVVGLTFQTAQTTLTALAWYFILVAGYPDGGVRYRDILAAYATGVAMNGFLPANINFKAPDDGLGLNIVANATQPAEIDTVLSNSFGFGGTNASILFTRFRE